VSLTLDSRPGLRRGVKLAHDPVRDRMALLYPEGVLLLNDTAAAVLAWCDGRRTVPEVATALAEEYEGVDAVAGTAGDARRDHLPLPVALRLLLEPGQPHRLHRGTGYHDWLRVLEQARALGVLQVHFSGGEPMLRRDLSTLVSRAPRNSAGLEIAADGQVLDL